MTTNYSGIKRPHSLRAPVGRNSQRVSRSALALAIALTGSATAMAQDADDEIVLDTIKVKDRTADTNPYAEAGAPYKARISGDDRRVKPLAETPATISVLTQTQIQDSGKSDLREVLVAQPGITLGTGENGNAFGDRYIIRGHEARSDVFVDGLRDPGMTIRESFAVEQIEVTKGPSATFAGRGSSGGAVNSITKQASTDYDFTKLQAGVGTDNYYRATLDANQKLSDDLALRANLLMAEEDVPDRDPADRVRQGAALSAAYQATPKLNLVLDYYFLDAEDSPDLGTYIDSATGRPVKDIPVYTQDADFLQSQVNATTFRLGYDFNDAVRLENAMRYGTTKNRYVVTGARGATRSDDLLLGDPDAPGAATVSLSTHQGWQDVEYFVDQANLFIDAELAGMQHQFIVGLEYSELSVINGTYSVANNGATNCVLPGRGSNPPSGGYCIVDASGDWIYDNANLMGRDITKRGKDSDFDINTISLSLLDTIDLNDHWTVHLGLRVDDFDYSNKVGSAGVDWQYSDTLWNANVGVVYKITEQGNVYLNYSTATNINGGESDLGANCGYGGLCGIVDIVEQSEPEELQNIELGTKWDLLDNKLLLSAAVFQITKDDVMESASGFDYAANGFLNTGENQVEGIEFSAVGNVTDKLSVLFNVAIMNAEILDSYEPANKGKTLANFADNSAYLQLRYQLNSDFAIGAAATYSSEVYTGQPDSAANEDMSVPSYTVYDLFATYEVTKNLGVRLNVNNVTDEDYYFTAYRSGAFTYIGDAFNSQLTLTYSF